MQTITFLWHGLVFDQEFLIASEVVNVIVMSWAYYYQHKYQLKSLFSPQDLPIFHYCIAPQYSTHTGPQTNIFNLIIVTIIIKK